MTFPKDSGAPAQGKEILKSLQSLAQLLDKVGLKETGLESGTSARLWSWVEMYVSNAGTPNHLNLPLVLFFDGIFQALELGTSISSISSTFLDNPRCTKCGWFGGTLPSPKCLAALLSRRMAWRWQNSISSCPWKQPLIGRLGDVDEWSGTCSHSDYVCIIIANWGVLTKRLWFKNWRCPLLNFPSIRRR